MVTVKTGGFVKLFSISFLSPQSFDASDRNHGPPLPTFKYLLGNLITIYKMKMHSCRKLYLCRTKIPLNSL